jgi:hypothetical protein
VGSKRSVPTRMRAVAQSREYRRIKSLPTRGLIELPDLTPAFQKPGATWALRAIQSLALWEIEHCRGAFLPIGVGYGKTLIALLAPRALKAKRPVLITEAPLRDVLQKVEIPKYGQHFELPDWHAIISYNDLSNPRKPTLLEDLRPDAIVCDEVHNLRRLSSVRTKRVGRYLRGNPECKFVGMSGTITANSIKDYAHLAKWALGSGSPVPIDYWTLEEWAAALDPMSLVPLDPGVIGELCSHKHESARHSYCCRLTNTVGVVATEETSLGASLVLYARRPAVPDALRAILDDFRDTWAFDMGGESEEMADALSYYRLSHQLAMGFYYRPTWPNGRDEEWIKARSEWARTVRYFLRHRSRPGLDSEKLLTTALERGEVDLRGDSAAWERWQKVRHRSGPGREPIWLSDFIINDAAKWAAEGDNGVIWYRHTAVGAALGTSLNLPVFGEGDGVALARISRDDYPYIIASVRSHGTGQNLQSWNRSLLLGMLGAYKFEQSLARLHREGQTADAVESTIYQHTPELVSGFKNALKKADYIEATTKQKQKLNFATRVGFDG